MRSFDGWLIELDAAPRSTRYLAVDENEGLHWTSIPSRARRFATASAAQHFRDQHLDGAVVTRRHQW